MLVGWIKHCDCDADMTVKAGNGKPTAAVELDHYSHKCPDPKLPRPYCVAAWADAVRMRYNKEGWVPSASQITSCPIETKLKIDNDYIEDIYEDRRFLLRGTFAHEAFYNRIKDHPDYICEKELELPMEYEDGLSFSIFGTLDAYHKPTASIEDYKTQGEYSLKKKMKQSDTEVMEDAKTGRFVRQNMSQINVYATMVREVMEVPVENLILYYVDGLMNFRPFHVPIVEHDRMITVMRSRFRTLYEAVHDLKPLQEIESTYESINQFPASKSPVRYLLTQYLGG